MQARTRDAALDRAIKTAGSSAALAAAIGVTPQAVSQWRRTPMLQTLKVEKATGVSRHELRPDLYPRETEAAE